MKHNPTNGKYKHKNFRGAQAGGDPNLPVKPDEGSKSRAVPAGEIWAVPSMQVLIRVEASVEVPSNTDQTDTLEIRTCDSQAQS